MCASLMAKGSCAGVARLWSLAAAVAASVVLWTATTMAQTPTSIVSLDSDLAPYLDRFKLTVQRYFPVPARSAPSAFVELASRYPVFELLEPGS